MKTLKVAVRVLAFLTAMYILGNVVLWILAILFRFIAFLGGY